MTGSAEGFAGNVKLHEVPGCRGLLPPPRTVGLGKRREQITMWKRLYMNLFGISTFASMVIPWGKEESEIGERLIINNRIPIKDIIQQYERFIKTWTCDLNTLMKPDRPCSDWYGACVIPASARTLSEGITLRERLLMGLKVQYESGLHLDQEATTVCTGSVFSNGECPHVGTYGKELIVERHDVLSDAHFSYHAVSVIA